MSKQPQGETVARIDFAEHWLYSELLVKRRLVILTVW